MNKQVHVAVGVVVGKDGDILIARRPQHAHQGGLWEFPGGKVAPGEAVREALVRELSEELAIAVRTTEPLIQIHHDYGDKTVLLDVHKVTSFDGVARGNEGQPIEWVAVENLNRYSFPAANRAIITALTLPDRMLITGAASSSTQYLQCTEAALQNGLRLVQLRCPGMPASEYQALAQQMLLLCNIYKARLLLNTSPLAFETMAADGLHLNSDHLNSLAARPVADSVLLGASCHNVDEILQARRIGCDYITLSPVAYTNTHPEAVPMGWDEFGRLAAQAGVPVFALGGMNDSDVYSARLSGAQGIAAISCWWETLSSDSQSASDSETIPDS